MNLDKIQEMWQKDSVIDPDNLHDESLKIPQLHSKYYTLYNTITLLREKARDQYSKIKLERYNFYTGKAPAEAYVEEPFPYKVCLLYTSPSPRDRQKSRMPSSA